MMSKVAQKARAQNILSTALTQQHVEDARDHQAGYADTCQDFVEREKNENKDASGADDSDEKR